MRRTLYFFLIAVLIAAHIVLVNDLTKRYVSLKQAGYEEQLYALPTPLLRIIAFDYKGIASDFLFIKGIGYLGGFISGRAGERFKLSETQWRAFYQIMDASSDLDPYFQDPYYLANAFLTWDAGMIRETNVLLDKGSKYRDWDWVLPFFSGFNFFYFLQENDKAAEKLMEASRKHGDNVGLASLASKLAFKANKTENSIAFLEEILEKTVDENDKKEFLKRLEAYKAILLLEKAVDVFQRKFGVRPQKIDALVQMKLLKELPKDPYGGTFSLDSQGNVRTTSESQLLPHVKKR